MSKTIPKYLDVKHRIRDAIRQGIIADKLPGERILAKQYGVSYMTLRKAVDNLVAEGVLYRIPQTGTYVTPGDTSSVNESTNKNLREVIHLIAETPSGSPTFTINEPRSKRAFRGPAKGKNPAASNSELLRKLERENRELKLANEILRKVATYFAGVDEIQWPEKRGGGMSS